MSLQYLKELDNMSKLKTAGLAFGIDGEIVILSNFNKGWYKLAIPEKYKTIENYEHYCYLRYMCIDAETEFITKVRQLEKK